MTVVYPTMTMRWRTTSHDIEANHTICVLWSCYNVVRLNLRSYHIARPSNDLRTTSYRSHDHCTTLIYKAMLPSLPRNHSEAVCHRTTIVRLAYDVVRFTYDSASHQAIKVKSYVIVRLSFDCIMMSYDFTDITDGSQTHHFE